VVVGTRGQTPVAGPQLQSAFGLLSTYVRFTTISAATIRRPAAARDYLRLAPWGIGTLTGTVYPARTGALVQIQEWSGKRWRTIQRLPVARDGTYTGAVPTGSYRVLYNQVTGPTVSIGL
jgi:hypothetical protein